jgi:hypothetical protein
VEVASFVYRASHAKQEGVHVSGVADEESGKNPVTGQSSGVITGQRKVMGALLAIFSMLVIGASISTTDWWHGEFRMSWDDVEVDLGLVHFEQCRDDSCKLLLTYFCQATQDQAGDFYSLTGYYRVLRDDSLRPCEGLLVVGAIFEAARYQKESDGRKRGLTMDFDSSDASPLVNDYVERLWRRMQAADLRPFIVCGALTLGFGVLSILLLLAVLMKGGKKPLPRWLALTTLITLLSLSAALFGMLLSNPFIGLERGDSLMICMIGIVSGLAAMRALWPRRPRGLYDPG